MKIISNLLTGSEILLLTAACIAPATFVEISSKLSTAAGFQLSSTAYGIAIIAISSIGSINRSIYQSFHKVSNSRIAFDLMVVSVSILMFYSTATSSSNETASIKDIVTPYLSYIISVVFSAGVGYALADLILSLKNLLRKNK